MIPGSNLLNLAFTIIKPTKVNLYRFSSKLENEIGNVVNSYEPPESITTGVQTVPRSVYRQMGLDFNKRYIRLWSSENFEDLQRDRSGDQIGYKGRRYELMNEEDWTPIDGWNGILAIDIGPDQA